MIEALLKHPGTIGQERSSRVISVICSIHCLHATFKRKSGNTASRKNTHKDDLTRFDLDLGSNLLQSQFRDPFRSGLAVSTAREITGNLSKLNKILLVATGRV